MVKKTAQTLQLFGTELAETELPNEIQATSILLSTHTEKKDKMKVKASQYHLKYEVDLVLNFFFQPHLLFCVCRRICRWPWVRAAGSWRASMNLWLGIQITI